MGVSVRFSRGRADPFGLLVVAVMLALSITVGIQAQASMVGERSAPLAACAGACTPDDAGR